MLLTAWPVWLWDFPDGLRIVAAREPYADLVGARVTMVGHLAVADARGRRSSRSSRATTALAPGQPAHLPDCCPMSCAERGVQPSGDAGLTLEMLDGTIREVELEALPIEAFRDWIFGVYGGDYPDGLPPDPDGHGHPAPRDRRIWSEPLATGGDVRRLQRGRSPTRGRRVDPRLATSRRRRRPTRGSGAPVVVDLRNNGGGDNTTYGPLRSAIERSAHAQPGTRRPDRRASTRSRRRATS